MMPSLLVCVLVLMCSATFALAQAPNKDDYPRYEIFGGYSALGDYTSNHEIGFTSNLKVRGSYAVNVNGFEASLTRNFTRHIGLKADFSAHFNNSNHPDVVNLCNPTCVSAVQETHLKTRVYNFLAGPEFKARNSTRFTPFVYALGGAAHTSAQFNSPGPPIFVDLKKSQMGFALAAGGGLDLRATKRVSLRGSIDYNPVFIQDSVTGTRDFVRFSIGALFH